MSKLSTKLKQKQSIVPQQIIKSRLLELSIEELEKDLNDKKFKTIDIKGLKFNPITKKWKKSNDLSVNYIICSSKN